MKPVDQASKRTSWVLPSLFIIQCLLVALKLTNWIVWAWWVVLIPAFLVISCFVLVVVLMAVALYLFGDARDDQP